jgi:uncharacterized membrane protein
MLSERRVSSIHKAVLVGLTLVGFGLNLLLFIKAITGSDIAGCGGGSACDELLRSRWADVLGIPVTAFGLLVYVGVMLGFTDRCRRMLPSFLGAIAGAAGWFIVIQWFVIGRFCPWCMAAHAVGLTIGVMGWHQQWWDEDADCPLRVYGGSAVLTVIAISLSQFLGPAAVTHRVDTLQTAKPVLGEVSGTAGVPSARSMTRIHAFGNGRKATFEGGKRVYDVDSLPHLGPTEAKRVMVKYFDYPCPACRTMDGFLGSLMAKHPDDICVVLLPVPMERSCNHALGGKEAQHPGSCEITQIALALWRIKPEAFPAWHHSVIASATPTAAREQALQAVSAEELDAALLDPWIDELIQANAKDWISFSTKTQALPKLLITDTRILHGLPSNEADFLRVMEQELGF